MRPYWTHALPNVLVSFAVVQATGSTGGAQRSAPTGGAANGTPFHEYEPLVLVSSLPTMGPKRVCLSVLASCGPAAASRGTDRARQAAARRKVWAMFLSPGGEVCD